MGFSDPFPRSGICNLNFIVFGLVLFFPGFSFDSKTLPAKTIIFASCHKKAFCFLIIHAPLLVDSSGAFGQPVSLRVDGSAAPEIQKYSRRRQNDDRQREPFQIDDECLGDGLFNIAFDFDVAESELHGNLLLVVGYRKLSLNR